MTEIVYAYGAGCTNGAVMIEKKLPSKSSWGKDRYYVYRLERIEQVHVLTEGMRYRLMWEKKPVRDWRSGKEFFDYKPYEDHDVSEEITKELIDYVKQLKPHMLQWYSTMGLKLERVPEGFKSYPGSPPGA